MSNWSRKNSHSREIMIRCRLNWHTSDTSMSSNWRSLMGSSLSFRPNYTTSPKKTGVCKSLNDSSAKKRGNQNWKSSSCKNASSSRRGGQPTPMQSPKQERPKQSTRKCIDCSNKKRKNTSTKQPKWTTTRSANETNNQRSQT